MENNFAKTVLDNGIRVVTERMPHARSIAMGVWVNVGARDETQEESGLSHFIEHMIFKGTEKRSAVQIAKELDAIGASWNAFTSKENTCYHAKVMDNYLNTAVDILSDIFLNSVFNDKEVERERQVILQEIKMLEDTPEDYVHVLLARTMWGGHSLGRCVLGTPQNIANFDSKTIRQFFKRAYQPERIVVSAAGNLNHARFVELVARTFEVVRRDDNFPQRLSPVMNKGITTQPKNLEQVHICLGIKGVSATDPRRHACAILNVILGGNMSSRLFQEVRERRGLAYSIYSFLSLYSDTGMLGVYAGVDKSNLQKVFEIISSQIKELKEKPVTASELKNAKQYLKGALYLAAENTENQMTRIAQTEINFGRYIPLKEAENEIERVTHENILELSSDIFHSEFAITLLGPIEGNVQIRQMVSL